MSVESINANSVAAGVQASTSQQTSNTQAASQESQVSQVSQESQESNTQAMPLDFVEAPQKMSAEEVQGLLDKMNAFMGSGQHNLNFSIDKDTDDMVVKVMDTETNEVIRQFPSEETLKLAKHIEGMLGLLLNDRA